MKLIYFVLNGIATPDDKAERERLRLKGYQVRFSNASILKGFQDSCDAVYLSCDAPHVEKWAASNDIKVMKPVVAEEPEPVKPKPAAKRGPKPKPSVDEKESDESPQEGE